MTLRYLFCLFIFSVFIACGSEPAETEEVTVEDIDFDRFDATPPAVDSSDTASIEDAPSPPPMTEEEKQAAKEIEEKRKKIVEEQIDKSEIKNCEQALARYKELTEDYLAGKNRWKEWDANNIIYNNCKNKPKYKPQYDALQAKMDEYDDE